MNTIDPFLFREAMGHYPTGVAAVTAVLEDGSPAAMVVGTFSSVSLDPPLIAFFPATSSGSFAHLRTATSFCVNVLASDQEPLCRQLATGGATKFDGVPWRPAPLGAPILEGAVSWIECTYDEIREAGDHYVVLGLVHRFAVERFTLPLLFFQGGYGQFSLGSFIAAPDPDLIQAAQVAETIRTQVEVLSAEFGVNCSVVAKIRDNSVQVLAANHGSVDEPFPLGHRQPLLPPFGAVFMVDSPPNEVDEWLDRAPDGTPQRRELNRGLLEKVRRCGYSVLAAAPETLERHQAVLSAFEESGGLPRNERVVRQVTSELAELFCPDLVPGERYDLASIVVLVPTRSDLPPIALRMSGLPPAASTEQIESWIRGLKRVATAAGQPATVEAAIVDAPGAAPRLGSVLLPPTTRGTSLVAVVATPVNPLDLAIASGAFHSARHESSYVPGSECVGRVLESDVHPAGSWVYAECHASPSSPGAFAAQVLVADDDLLLLPDGLDPVLAAAVGNSGVAAFLPLVEEARLQPGETVLVLGASGAVGQLAVQVARGHGAGRVVGVARDRAALQRVLDLGADEIVELRQGEPVADLAARLAAAAGPVDVVLDGVYGEPLEAALHACAPHARVVNIGNPAGATARIPAGLLRGKQLTLSGFAGLHTPLQDKRAALSWLWAALVRGDLRIDVRTFRLQEVTAAWQTQAESPHAKCVIVSETDRRPALTGAAR